MAEQTKSAAAPDASNLISHSASYYFLQSFNELNIEYLFCNFGTDHAPIIEELAKFKSKGMKAPRVIICPHENVAIHMAGGFAQMTGRGQAVLVHVDSGTANAALGMHNLFRNRVPVMLIAGAAPFTSRGELTGSRDTYVHFIQQPFDQGSLVRPYVKWEYTLPSGVIAPEVLRRAHSMMQSEPKGPIYLMLPREVLTDHWPEQTVHHYSGDQYGSMEMGGADPEIIDSLAKQILTSSNPCLITSHGGRDPALSDAIQKLAAITGLRVIDYLTFSNIGRSFPEFNGFEYNDLDKIDLGLLVDIDVPWMPLNTKLSESTFWAHIDIDPLKTATPVWTFPANIRVQGKSSRILSQLTAKVQEIATPAFKTKAKARSEALTSEQTSKAQRAEEMAADGGAIGEINPHFFCRILGQLIAPEDLIVNELVTRQSIPNIQIARPIPNTMISNAGGGLGASGGTALGVKLAKPDRCVIQIVGDGSFYFNNPTAVFAVAEQYRLPIFCIVLDNNGWAAVKGATLRVYPQGTAKEIGAYQSIHSPQMDFSKIAEAAGAYGEKLTRPEDVKSAITRCLEQVRAGRSALLHVHVTKH